MDGSRFDGWTRTLATADRRRVLGGVLGLMAATMPGRSLGADDPDCTPKRKRAEACERTCQCRGDYRCGQPRMPEERDDCGQNLNADQVCCSGKGDSCSGNDCECCGQLQCVNGRCRESCIGREGECCAGGRCRGGQCVANYATLAECLGRCDRPDLHAFATICNQEAPCPDCYRRDVCPSGCSVIAFADGPQGLSNYCTHESTGSCPGTKASECPAGSACNSSFAHPLCYRICTGA